MWLVGFDIFISMEESGGRKKAGEGKKEGSKVRKG